MNLNPIELLREAVKQVPALKFGFGIIGLAAIAAIVKGLNINNYRVPVITLLMLLGLTVLILIFVNLAKSDSSAIKWAGNILLFSVLIFAVGSCGLLLTSVFFDYPKKISEYPFFQIGDIKKPDTTKSTVQSPVIKTVQKNVDLTSNPTGQLREIKGHVYSPSGQPLPHITIIPSFYEPNASSDDAGRFRFSEVPYEQIKDSLKLSFRYKSCFLISESIPEHRYDNWINIVLSLKKLTKKQLEAILRAKPDAYVLDNFQQSSTRDTLQDLISPLRTLLNQNSGIASANTYTYSEEDYHRDTNILRLINSNGNLTPRSLKLNVDSIYHDAFINSDLFAKEQGKLHNRSSSAALALRITSPEQHPVTSSQVIRRF